MTKGKGNTTLQKQRRQQRQQSLPKFECPCGTILTPTDANVYAHRKTAKHTLWETQTGFPSQQISSEIQMKKTTWIAALKQWNEGKPAWCIPRKNTPEHQEVLAIKLGQSPVVTFHPESTETITLPTIAPEPAVKKRRTIKVKLPTEPVDPLIAINKQLEEETKTGIFSIDYDLHWRPKTTEQVYSAASRIPNHQLMDYAYALGISDELTHLDVNKLKDFVKENENKRDDPKTRTYIERRVKEARELIETIPAWKPQNYYSSRGVNYNTKKKLTNKDVDEDVLKALNDYQVFADEVNKLRGTPIRNITIRSKFYQDGTRNLTASWTIDRSFSENGKDYYRTHHYFVREYQITPEFKFLKGSTIESIKEEIRRTAEEKAAKEKREADRKANDPRIPIKEKLDDLDRQVSDIRFKQRSLTSKHSYGTDAYKAVYQSDEYKALQTEERRLFTEKNKLETELKKVEKQLKAARDATEEGSRIVELKKQKKDLEKQYHKNAMPYKDYKAQTDAIDEEIKALNKILRSK